MSTENLKVIITGDASGLDKASAGAKKAMDEVSASAAAWDKRARELNIQTNHTRRAYSDMGTSAVQAARKVEQTAVQVQEASNAMRLMSKTSSSATNSLFALGGIVQDAPYGFRAIANNITFFSQEMAYSAKAAGGFGAAIKAMGSAFLGPAGIIFAISAVVSLLDVFLSGSHKAAAATNELAQNLKNMRDSLKTVADVQGDTTASAARQTAELQALYAAATDVTRSQKERFKAAADLQQQWPQSFGALSQMKIISGGAADAFDKLSKSILKVAQANVVLQEMEDNLKKIGDAQKNVDKATDPKKLAELIQNYTDAQDELQDANANLRTGIGQGGFGGIAMAQKAFDDARDALNAYTGTISGYNKIIQDATDDNKKLQDSFNALNLKTKPDGGGTGGNIKTIADVLADLKTKFQAVDTLAKGLGQSQEQIATEKIKLLYEYVQKIADVGGPGAVKAIQQLVDEANQIGAKGFLPTLSGGRAGVNAPAGITSAGVPTSIPLSGAPTGIGVSNPEKLAKAQGSIINPLLDQMNKLGLITDNVFDDVNQKLKQSSGAANVLSDAFENIFTTIANGGNPFQALISAVEQLIIKLVIAEATVAALNLIPGGSAVLKALDLVAAVPHFAGGGYIPSPTLAVVGDAPGGEWVMNQRQISAILNGAGNRGASIPDKIELTAKGNDLVAVVRTTLEREGRRNGTTEL